MSNSERTSVKNFINKLETITAAFPNHAAAWYFLSKALMTLTPNNDSNIKKCIKKTLEFDLTYNSIILEAVACVGLSYSYPYLAKEIVNLIPNSDSLITSESATVSQLSMLAHLAETFQKWTKASLFAEKLFEKDPLLGFSLPTVKVFRNNGANTDCLSSSRERYKFD